MSMLGSVYRRELNAFFRSMIAYVLLVAFLVISGIFFLVAVLGYARASMQAMQNPMFMNINLQEFVVDPMYRTMTIILMFISPLLTMRLISEEKRSGTIELLLSYPLRVSSVVLGKFLAAWTVYGIMVAATLLHPLLLAWLGEPHWATVGSSYLGLLLVGGAFLALGMLASALTENQIVAAVLGFIGLLGLWVLGWTASLTGPGVGKVLTALSLWNHSDNYPKGILDTADFAYVALFIGFFLFLTTRILEAKRWKA